MSLVSRRLGMGTCGRLRVALFLAFSLLVIAALGGFVIARITETSEHWADHSMAVRQASSALFSAVQDAETGQRGYLLTGKPNYLGPFKGAGTRIPATPTVACPSSDRRC